jgi:hypothetical protein
VFYRAGQIVTPWIGDDDEDAGPDKEELAEQAALRVVGDSEPEGLQCAKPAPR